MNMLDLEKISHWFSWVISPMIQWKVILFHVITPKKNKNKKNPNINKYSKNKLQKFSTDSDSGVVSYSDLLSNKKRKAADVHIVARSHSNVPFSYRWLCDSFLAILPHNTSTPCPRARHVVSACLFLIRSSFGMPRSGVALHSGTAWTACSSQHVI